MNTFFTEHLPVAAFESLKEVVLSLRLQINLLMNQIINYQMNFMNHLLENFKKEKFFHILETIFGVLI